MIIITTYTLQSLIRPADKILAEIVRSSARVDYKKHYFVPFHKKKNILKLKFCFKIKLKLLNLKKKKKSCGFILLPN